MRLIDADAFEKDFKEKLFPALVKKYGEDEALKGLHFSFRDCIVNIQTRPTIAIGVIECKDCEHYDDQNRCELNEYFHFNENDFCSYGKKRVNNAEGRR